MNSQIKSLFRRLFLIPLILVVLSCGQTAAPIGGELPKAGGLISSVKDEPAMILDSVSGIPVRPAVGALLEEATPIGTMEYFGISN